MIPETTIYNSILEVIDGENYLDLQNFLMWTEKFPALGVWYRQMKKFYLKIDVDWARSHFSEIEDLLYKQKDFKAKFAGYVHVNSIAFEGSAEVTYLKDRKIKVTWISKE